MSGKSTLDVVPDVEQDDVEEVDAEKGEVERLIPESGPVTLDNGLEVEVLPLKLRQFLKFLRIITVGAGASWNVVNLNMNDPESFSRDIMALALFAIPEAEEEVIEFLRSAVVPANLPGTKTKEDRERSEELIMDLQVELDNPEIEDVLVVLETLLAREAKDIVKLGKRLKSMMATVQKTGLMKNFSNS